MLKKVGIVKRNTKSYEVFNKCISDDFLKIEKMKSSEYIKECWDRYCKSSHQNNSLNGSIFEYIIISEMYRQSIYPMYLQAQIAFVPNVKFDVLLYTDEEIPIGISLKTSLRERYKQADLEAAALKNVHRLAKNYLITLNKKEAETVNEKIKNKIILGLNDVVVAIDSEFDVLVEELKKKNLIKPEKDNIITAGNVVENKF